MDAVNDERASDEQAGAPSGRADAVRSAVECVAVAAFALAIPAACLVLAWRLAPSGFGKGVVLMAGVTMAVLTAGAGVMIFFRTVGAGARRRRTAALRGRCARCGYNLEGLRGDTCPECGAIRDPGLGLARSDDR